MYFLQSLLAFQDVKDVTERSEKENFVSNPSSPFNLQDLGHTLEKLASA
jgi:hypothetical protein